MRTFSSSDSQYITLHGRRDFSDVIKNLIWEDCPELYRVGPMWSQASLEEGRRAGFMGGDERTDAEAGGLPSVS